MDTDLDLSPELQRYNWYIADFLICIKVEKLNSWFPISLTIFSSGQSLPDEINLYRNFTREEFINEYKQLTTS